MTEPGRSPLPPRQGDVLISNPSPLTGERELYTVVSVDMLGEYFGQLTDAQRTRVINQIVAVLRGH